jgi:para-nitrobenzyl esterase
VVFPDPPADAMAAGLSADVPALVGTNRDEWRFFGFTDPAAYTLDEPALRARLDQAIHRAPAVLDAYAAARPGASPSDLWFAIESDRIFRIPAVHLAEAQSRHQPKTFAYLFEQCSAIDMLGACHALEIPFVFGTLDQPGMAMFAGDTPEVRELATKMQDAWLAFARTGDPTHAGLPAWPGYDAERRATMLLGETCRVEDDPLGAERRAWDAPADA